ncbi:DUF6883 domain-containing protein [Rudanella lutea]|uniref:DUF6883 domain-containing protein n=1 Tax=Rudanella lutea TaxID=451374 RepID=UPI0003616DFF
MRLEPPLRVDIRKLTHYLLVRLEQDDKSNYLSLAGYEQLSWKQLEQDLFRLVQSTDAVLERTNGYGTLYSVTGYLTGPNGRSILVKTIWMRDDDEELTKFITLYPPK